MEGYLLNRTECRRVQMLKYLGETGFTRAMCGVNVRHVSAREGGLLAGGTGHVGRGY